MSENITINDVIEYLNYGTDFWEYIKNKIKVYPYIEDTTFYITSYKTDKDNNIIDIKVIIPKVSDMKSASIAIHELKHAHDLYLLLNKKMNKTIEEYEILAKEEEKIFQKSIKLKNNIQ